MAGNRATLVSFVVALALAPQVHAHTTACDKARATLISLDNALRLYAAEHGTLPLKNQWIEALVRERSIGGPDYARDPWGHDYVFAPGKGGEDYDLRSAGPDGKPGTEDDLVRANDWKSPTCLEPSGCRGCTG